MADRFAARTSVDPGQSRQEIERTLERYGATAFAYAWEADRAVIGFKMEDRQVRFVLPMPDRNAEAFTHYRRGGSRVERTESATRELYAQAMRQRWRALALVVKAKLEAVAAGITEFEDEFLAHIVLPDGRTVGEHARPALALAYERGTVPPLLPGPRHDG